MLRFPESFTKIRPQVFEVFCKQTDADIHLLVGGKIFVKIYAGVWIIGHPQILCLLTLPAWLGLDCNPGLYGPGIRISN